MKKLSSLLLLLLCFWVNQSIYAQSQPGGFDHKWADYPAGEFGPYDITFDYTGAREIEAAPPPGVHPRVLISPSEIPAMVDRLLNTVSGQQAFNQMHAYTTLQHLGYVGIGYDHNADYGHDEQGVRYIGNAGAFDISSYYAKLVNNDLTAAADLEAIGNNGWQRLAGIMALEALECLVMTTADPDAFDEDTGLRYDDRAAMLGRAMSNWAQIVFDDPYLSSYNYMMFGGVHMAMAYDLNYNSMTTNQQDSVRMTLAEIVSTYPLYGSHTAYYSTTSNWVGLNTFELLTNYAIEGEQGHNPNLEAMYMRAYRNFLTYGWYASGAPYEGLGKNYIFATSLIAAAKRGYSLFGHPHLRAYGQKFLPAITQPYWHGFIGTDAWGGTGLYVEQGGYKNNPADYVGLKWVYPDDPSVDFAWRNYIEKIHTKDSYGYVYQEVYPHGYLCNLLKSVMFATDYNAGELTEQTTTALGGEKTFFAPERGLLTMRSDFDSLAMMSHFHCRQDLGGHTYGDRNNFTLSALGRDWVRYSYGPSYTATSWHSCPLINDLGLHPGSKIPIPGKVVNFEDDGVFTQITGDATYAYSWEWHSATGLPSQPHYWLGTGEWTEVTETRNDFRYEPGEADFLNIPFYRYASWQYPGYEEHYIKRPYNMMQRVMRTLAMMRTDKPYMLVVDDLQKDSLVHNYKWALQISPDLTIESTDVNIAEQDYRCDVILAEPNGNRKMLVRVLNNEGYTGGAPAWIDTLYVNPHSDMHITRLVVEADVVTPNFKIMLYPFTDGDALPVTDWNTGRDQLMVSLDGENQIYAFEESEEGQTDLSLIESFCADAPARPGGFYHKWDDYPTGTFGSLDVNFNNAGVRAVAPVPPVGVHPRVFLCSEEIPAMADRLQNTTSGQEAFSQMHAYTTLQHLGTSYNVNADYARDGSNIRYISNTGAFNINPFYYKLVNGDPTALDGLTNDGRQKLASTMSLDALECLVMMSTDPAAYDEDTGLRYDDRAAMLGRAMSNWAQLVFDAPDLTPNNYVKFGGVHMAMAYDLNYNSMTTSQQDSVRMTLAKIIPTTMRYGSGVAPYSTTRNLAASNAFDLLTNYAIEGEAGYNPTLEEEFMLTYRNFLTYGWYASGAPYEGLGQNNVMATSLIAAAKRGYSLLGHPHFRAYGNNFLPAITQPYWHSFVSTDLWGGTGPGTEQGGYKNNPPDAVGLKWIYPDDAGVDFAWRNYIEKIYDMDAYGYVYQEIYPNGNFCNLLTTIMFTSDYETGGKAAQSKKALQSKSFFAPDRGLAVLRSGHDSLDMMTHFHCRQDMGGQTYGDRNNFTMSALGRDWVRYTYANIFQDTRFHSCLLIDDKGVKVTPRDGGKARQPGKVLNFEDDGTMAQVAGDATYAYSWEWDWVNNVPGADYPFLGAGYWTEVTETPNDFRYQQGTEGHLDIPFYEYASAQTGGFQEHIVKGPYNPMERVYRTVAMVRCAHPYMLIIDDVQKDSTVHNYKWLAQVAGDLSIESWDVNLEDEDYRCDVILAEPNGNRKLLVRILNNDGYTGGIPAVLDTIDINAYYPLSRLLIEANVVTPNFKVMLYPFTAGDPLPVTSWTSLKHGLMVSIDDEEKIIGFEEIDGRTHIELLDEISLQFAYPNRVPHPIPGTIEVEDYDLGGQDIAYFDSDVPNNGNANYRPDESVDIESADGGYTVGYTDLNNGMEWLEYTVNVTEGTYDMELRVATEGTGNMLVAKLDSIILDTFHLPNTGGLANFQIARVNSIPFTGGEEKILRLEFIGSGIHTNWMKFVPVVASNIGNDHNTTGALDGWAAGMVINETDIYMNDSGARQEVSVDYFSFYAGIKRNPLTPFVVKVNGDNDLLF